MVDYLSQSSHAHVAISVDVRSVVTRTRHVPEALKLAIAERDQRCKVRGCDRRHRLERHHTLEFHEHHLTSYEVLGNLCGDQHDLVSYHRKVNDCSPLNPICCADPLSAFCDEAKKSGAGEPSPGTGPHLDDNISRNWGDEDTKRQMMRNFFALMMVSQGTPMLYGGDEWLRTQLGNNNTYTPQADNPYSWHDWGAWEALLSAREEFPGAGPDSALAIETDIGFGTSSSALIALPSVERTGVKPVWLFAAGLPRPGAWRRLAGCPAGRSWRRRRPASRPAGG